MTLAAASRTESENRTHTYAWCALLSFAFSLAGCDSSVSVGEDQCFSRDECGIKAVPFKRSAQAESLSTRDLLTIEPAWTRSGGIDATYSPTLHTAPDGSIWRFSVLPEGGSLRILQLDEDGEPIARGELRAALSGSCLEPASAASFSPSRGPGGFTAALSWTCLGKSDSTVMLSEVVRFGARADEKPTRLRVDLEGRGLADAMRDADGNYLLVYQSGLASPTVPRDDGPLVRKVNSRGKTIWQRERFVPFAGVFGHTALLLPSGELELIARTTDDLSFLRFTLEGDIYARSVLDIMPANLAAVVAGSGEPFVAGALSGGGIGGSDGDLAVLRLIARDAVTSRWVERWDYQPLELYGATSDADGTPYVLAATGTRAERWPIICAFPDDEAPRCFRLSGLTSDANASWTIAFTGGSSKSLYVLWTDDESDKLMRFDMP